jgi:hypothetical protein
MQPNYHQAHGEQCIEPNPWMSNREVLFHEQVEATMIRISQTFSIQSAKQFASNSNISELLANSPQTITQPLSHTVNNLRPFDVPVYAFNAVPLISFVSH